MPTTGSPRSSGDDAVARRRGVASTQRRPDDIRVRFKQCILDSPDYGSTLNEPLSRIYFDVCREGEAPAAAYVDVLLTSRVPGEARLLLGAVHGDTGSWDDQAFFSAVSHYYWRCAVALGAHPGRLDAGFRPFVNTSLLCREDTFLPPG